jgi:hypothetical protein
MEVLVHFWRLDVLYFWSMEVLVHFWRLDALFNFRGLDVALV